MPVEITRSFGHPEQTLKVPLLIKSATSQSVVVCLFLQFLLACMYGGQFQILFDKFPNLQSNKFLVFFIYMLL